MSCVDASLVVAWLVPSQRSPLVVDTWEAYFRGEHEFVGPPSLCVETVSAIRRLAFRGLLFEQEALDLVHEFLGFNVPTPSPTGLYQRAYELATRYRHSTIYDACYLALAELLSCPLLTLDQRFHKAVAADFPWVRLVG